MENKVKIADYKNYKLSKVSMEILTVRGGDTHYTIEYFGDQACKDVYYDTLGACDIKCTGEPTC